MAILSEESKIRRDGKETITYKLMNDSSAAETTSDAISAINADSVSIVVESSAGVSGGVVTLEGALTSDYTGTWASLTTATANAATKTFVATNDMSDSAAVPLPYVRARISTVITGGTVDVYMIVRK